MTFLWPGALAGLAGVALLAAVYARIAVRRVHPSVAHTQAPLLDSAQRGGCRLCRHLPAVLFALALSGLVLAAARPVLPWPTPRGWPVALVIDVSRSMEENDIRPSRLAAAKAAAAEFARGLPRTTPAALVTFGNYASVVVPLTTDRDRLLTGISLLTTQLRTQLGNGLLEGIRVLTGEGALGAAPPGGPSPAPGNPLTHPRAVVVLLSDGRASDGIPPLEAAREAQARRVRVHTVGMGTFGDPTQFRSGYWGVLDEPALRAVADTTGGQYFHAASAGRLRQIYRELARTVGWTRTSQEASAGAAAGALLAFLAAAAYRFRFFVLP